MRHKHIELITFLTVPSMHIWAQCLLSRLSAYLYLYKTLSCEWSTLIGLSLCTWIISALRWCSYVEGTSVYCKDFQKAGWPTLHVWLFVSFKIHIQIPPGRLRGSHITEYRWGYYKSEYRWGYYEGALTLLWLELLCIQKLQSTLKVPSTVLRLAVAIVVLRNMRPT